MKGILLVVTLAATLLGLLAAPALATTSDPDFRLASNTAYVWAFWDGSWFEVKDVSDPSSFVGHWATYNHAGTAVVRPAEPIPANYDVVMLESLKWIPLGQIQTLPEKFLISLSIPEAGVDLSYERSKAFWTLHVWDEYWVAATGALIVGFNPKIGAQAYANTWLAPLTGKSGLATNLTADKKLPRGTYTVHYTESLAQPLTDLELYYDDLGNPLPRVWEWTHFMPYTSDPVVFTFKVGAPVK